MSKQDKRIRNVAKDLYQAVSDELVNPRLDRIEKFVQDSLAKMQKQQDRVHGFILQEVKFVIANQLDDQKVTIEAFLEVVNEKLSIPNFQQEIQDRKGAVRERLRAEAEAQMKADQEAARVAAESAAAAEAPAQEVPAAPAPEVSPDVAQ